MSSGNQAPQQNWPRRVAIKTFSTPELNGAIEISTGITTLVGPNGTGKTRALRAVKNSLMTPGMPGFNRSVYYLASGRGAPFENYRSVNVQPHYLETADAAVGNLSYQSQWTAFESITGILLAIEKRSDLRLKIEARLQQLFDRNLRLTWTQPGLQVHFSSTAGGAPYAANVEASGILQLVGLLGAIHHDEIGALIVDEPEISLHPQHQAFLLEEMERVAGDPSDPQKKIIVIATHSPSFLSLRKISELPAIVFFNSSSTLPAQVPNSSDILKRRKLGALIARLSATHRLAMFAERVLLVEGPSDEIISTQLARRFGLRTLARNMHILPVTGKGEFAEAAKLFSAMNKQVAVLADLDALSDSNELVRQFSELPNAAVVAQRLGHSSLADLDRGLRSDLPTFMSKHQTDVDLAASSYPDWSSKESSNLSKSRVTLARILTDPESFGVNAAADAVSLHNRYKALLDALGEVGCFFLRKGAIENYYSSTAGDKGKPDRAAEESENFENTDSNLLKQNYSDIMDALIFISPSQRVDEDLLLRPKLGAAIAAVLLGMQPSSTDGQLNAIAEATICKDANTFAFSNASSDKVRLRVDIASKLFHRDGFPLELSRDDNPNHLILSKLPGNDRS